MDFAARLRERARLGGVSVSDLLVEPLLAYYQLLRHWNEKINLTALGDTDEGIDRLLLEPIAAAHVIRKHRARTEHLALIDLGSGGGSPAVPLALALGLERLVMVESRGRKAAFLREAARRVPIASTVEVESQRFEDLARRESFREAMDLVSLRAVRIDASTIEAAAAFLRPNGYIAVFRGPEGPDIPASAPRHVAHVATERLLCSSTSRLTLLSRV